MHNLYVLLKLKASLENGGTSLNVLSVLYNVIMAD